MELKTASSVITYLSAMEAQSADWYLLHARKLPALDELFTAFARENQKFGKRLKKAYYSGVTDALETNFGFQGLEATVTIPEVPESAGSEKLLTLSLDLEESIQSVYQRAAALSRDLLADVPRAMERLGRARDKRLGQIQAALQTLRTS